MNTPIRQIDVSAYTVPTESPESDGTLIWDSTTLVLVEAHAGGQVGIGYTYAAPAAGRLIRCAGITGFLQAGALCEAYGLPLSAHTAPSLHAPLCCALGRARHVEYFFDHARIEPMFFDVGIFEFEAQSRAGSVRLETTIDDARRAGIVLDDLRDAAEEHHLTDKPQANRL